MNPLPVSVRPEAEEEAREAARWYEERAQGLGTAFLELVEQALAGISENPFRFPEVYRDVRMALLKRFPYGVFFRLRPGEVRVTAIVHLARDPQRWKRRR